MNAISFTASLVERQTEIKPGEKVPSVKERQPNGRFKDKDTVFLRMSKTKADRKTILDLDKLWNSECTFVSSILSDRDYYEKEDKTIYVISEQKDNFRKVDPKTILGIAEITRNKKNYNINFIQTRPDCISKKKLRPFKNIGDAMMDRLIDLTGDLKIYLKSLPEVTGFYERFGYEIVDDSTAAPLMVLIKGKKRPKIRKL